MDRRVFLGTVGAAAVLPAAGWAQDAAPGWVKLPTEPYRGKQDDISFVDALTGWYGNGAGKLFRTTDGGQTWVQQMDRPGTFVRALGFIDEKRGFLGNIGPDYFPNVSDTTPLYRTRDGGESWEPVVIDGPPVKGICAIDILKTPFINAGVLDHRVTVRAGGRV
ncbi:MAG: WD40/YVTN/BNR-like repeat-containing protein, partial [bacterium]